MPSRAHRGSTQPGRYGPRAVSDGDNNSASGGRARGITQRRPVGVVALWRRAVTRHPLTLGTVTEHPLDRGAIEQHSPVGLDVRERTPLGFGPQPCHRNAQRSGHFSEGQGSLGWCGMHAWSIAGSLTRCAGVVSACAPELCHRAGIAELEPSGRECVSLAFAMRAINQSEARQLAQQPPHGFTIATWPSPRHVDHGLARHW